jgi:hypothetical protein
MRLGQPVKRRLVTLVPPENGEVTFLVALKVGRTHGGPDEITIRCRSSCHWL